VEHYKGENEELVRKYEKTKEELEEAIEKLNKEVNAQRSETQLHISKLESQHTLSEQKFMEEVILSNNYYISCRRKSNSMQKILETSAICTLELHIIKAVAVILPFQKKSVLFFSGGMWLGGVVGNLFLIFI
jgi:hypothetical protein